MMRGCTWLLVAGLATALLGCQGKTGEEGSNADAASARPVAIEGELVVLKLPNMT